ncbi:hypothetical protein JTB14_016957 [Gonioctena quinquepunctata]|nr:hypothetical protein JTB14_016957 [Gonioctena quinquepunctata]
MEAPQDIHQIIHKVSTEEGIPETGKKLEVVVKKAFDDESLRINFPMEKMFLNECLFYKTIWPTLVEGSSEVFDKIPKCYSMDITTNKEKLVLENLKFKNFEVLQKKNFFDKNHVELIFSEYGKFHGLSFAYKTKFPQNFQEISSGLWNFWHHVEDMKVMTESMEITVKQCAKFLTTEDDTEMVDKFKVYEDQVLDIFLESVKYEGDHSVILHGDCWSNNIMFRYDEFKKPIDIRLIDFQITNLSTPVFDLSYCLYSGGSREIFDELDYYLAVYRKSLAETLVKLKCHPELEYSLDMIKEEWRKHCRFGFIMGLLILKGKLVNKDGDKDISEILSKSGEMEEMEAGMYNEGAYKKKCLDLIRHMHVNGFL